MKRSKTRVFIVSGPSGSGKTTICAQILKSGLGLVNSVSYTTRLPRGKEEQGVDYVFISKEKFLKGIDNGDFLEYAEIFGNLYGTPKKNVDKVLSKGKDVLLCIDVQGAGQVKRNLKEAVLIFIVPPSFDELKKRLIKRSSETEEQIRERLRIAKEELKQASFYDYVIVNDDIKDAVRELKAVIFAERRKKFIAIDKNISCD